MGNWRSFWCCRRYFISRESKRQSSCQSADHSEKLPTCEPSFFIRTKSNAMGIDFHEVFLCSFLAPELKTACRVIKWDDYLSSIEIATKGDRQECFRRSMIGA